MKQLQLLIFTIGENRYGVDADQIACLRNYDPARQVFRFHELVAAKPTSYVAPKILMVKNRETYPAVLINEPEDMIYISLKDIRPLPVLMASLANRSGVWGVVPQVQGMMVLFDFYKNEWFCQSGV